MAKVFHFHAPIHRRKNAEETEAATKPEPTTPPVPTKRNTKLLVRKLRLLIYGLVLGALFLVLMVEFARAGGPEYVAGISYFNAGLAGQPVTWLNGTVNYYTDQGDLSPVLQGANADAFVADAFARWTGSPTAAVSATRAGQLAEDVNGSNVLLNVDHTITMPADILPSATATPVGIVYDADGAVTDALLGVGSSGECFSNAAFGGPDAFTPDGHIAHALVVLDGDCAQTPADLPDLKYRLVRVLGRVFGLGWSQMNLNVITGSPRATTDDNLGFPLMRGQDSIACVPISVCLLNADQPKMDDRASLARLIPSPARIWRSFPASTFSRRARRAFMARCGSRMGAAIGRNPCNG